MALQRKDLDARGCDSPGCDHAGHAARMHLHQRCHVGGGLTASYQDGVLGLVCKVCSKPLVEIEVAGVIDWSKLTPRETFDALQAAPKVAGPWKHVYPDDQTSLYENRVTPDGTIAVETMPSALGHGVTWNSDPGDRSGWEPNTARAKRTGDQVLVEAGWLLVDGDD